LKTYWNVNERLTLDTSLTYAPQESYTSRPTASIPVSPPKAAVIRARSKPPGSPTTPPGPTNWR
ncbi:hypothetical protein, partial [Pseudomonas viridiflava]|uniref:hypothetical protein n=1 Tax=Pseudomonas viridiflava TaxID=33069 RepID=UPI00197D0975